MALSITGRGLPSIASLATVGVIASVIGWVMQDYHTAYKDIGPALEMIDMAGSFGEQDGTIYMKAALWSAYLVYLVPVGALLLLARLLMRRAPGGSKRGFTWNTAFVMVLLPVIAGVLLLVGANGGDWGATFDLIKNEMTMAGVGDFFLNLWEPMGHKLMIGGGLLTFISSIVDLTATSHD